MTSILEEAQKIVTGDRRNDYGDAYENMLHIAEMVTAYLKHKLKPGVSISPSDIAKFNILQKLSRSVTADKRDNRVDTAGYAYVWDYCAEREFKSSPIDMEQIVKLLAEEGLWDRVKAELKNAIEKEAVCGNH